MNPFKDSVAMVTGGASGIGCALSEGLGQRGAVVIVADINSKGAQKVATAINRNGGQAHATDLDVSKSGQVKQLIHEIVKEHRHLGRQVLRKTRLVGGVEGHN